MNRLSTVQPVEETRLGWRLSLIVLLLCGFAFWHGTERTVTSPADRAHLIGNADRILVGIPGENSLATHRIRKHEPATGPSADREPVWHGLIGTGTALAILPSGPSALSHISASVPRASRFQPQSPRAPPLA